MLFSRCFLKYDFLESALKGGHAGVQLTPNVIATVIDEDFAAHLLPTE
jgi:hypothetical protein